MTTVPQIWRVPDGVRGLLLDLDGTLYMGERPIPGAARFVQDARAAGRRLLFLTNNSSRSAADWAAKLGRLGFNATADEVFSSGRATALYLARTAPGKRVYLLGTDALRGELAEQGVACADDGAEIVVVGFDTGLTYARLTRACRYLLDGLPFIATHPDRVCPTEDGPIPDAGSFLALIEAATGRRPDVIIGKPNQPLIDGALERLRLRPQEVAMVGDRLYTDMAMARAAGLTAVLVLSGETTPAMLERLAPEARPDIVIASVAAAEFAPRL